MKLKTKDRTSETDAELREKGKKYLWLSFGRDESWFDQGLILSRAQGHYVYDVGGNRYFDAMSGQGAVMLGYNHPAVVEAMVVQMQKITGNASGWPASVPQIQLAEKIVSLAPPGLSKVFFACNGTDATETAVKIARQYWKLRGKATKYKVIVRWGGYHGSSLAMSAASGYPWRRKSFEPLPVGFVHIKPPYCYRCPYGLTYPSCGVECAEEFRKVVEYEDPSTVAAYMGEFTIAGGGVIPPPPGYAERVRELCDRYEILMIADEIVTGFGKTGSWFECQQLGVVPDMVTAGKALTGGHAALSAVVAKAEIAQTFSGDSDACLHHGYTFGGMPVACAAGLAAIESVEEQDLVAQVPSKSGFFRQLLEPLRELGIVGDIRSTGLMVGIELVKDRRTKEGFSQPNRVRDALIGLARQNGIHIASLGTRMHFFLPLTVTNEELEWLAQATQRILRELASRFG